MLHGAQSCIMLYHMTKSELAAARKAITDRPPFDPAKASIEDFTCSFCRETVPVEWTDEMAPSGTHHKVRCSSGHITNGIPAKR